MVVQTRGDETQKDDQNWVGKLAPWLITSGAIALGAGGGALAAKLKGSAKVQPAEKPPAEEPVDYSQIDPKFRPLILGKSQVDELRALAKEDPFLTRQKYLEHSEQQRGPRNARFENLYGPLFE